MREINYVEMADNDNIFQVGLGKRITMREDPDDPGYYQIMVGDEAVEDNLTKKDARKENLLGTI